MVIYNMFQNNIHMEYQKVKAEPNLMKNLYKGWMPPHYTFL